MMSALAHQYYPHNDNHARTRSTFGSGRGPEIVATNGPRDNAPEPPKDTQPEVGDASAESIESRESVFSIGCRSGVVHVFF